MRNLRKTSKLSIWMLLCIMAVVMALIPVKKAEAAEKKLSSITAVYTGESVLVGHAIDLNKVTVMGLYSDGSYGQVKDYTLSAYSVTKAGDNEITVYSEGVKATLLVRGKSVLRLGAYYAADYVTVGEKLDQKKLKVYVTYSDGTTVSVSDFYLPFSEVKVVGENQFVVSYEDKSCTFKVTGKEVKKPRTLFAYYNGPAIIVGNAPDRKDFYVSLSYNDNSVERVTEFELTPSVIQREGTNMVVVSYAGVTAEVKVQGLAKTVSSITAEYVGFPMVIGKVIDPEDIKVTATFNDGTKDTVTNFTLSSSVVYRVGDNLITVFCDNKTAYINVRGVEAEIIDYGNSAKTIIKEGDSRSTVTLAVGAKVDPKQVEITSVEQKLVKKAMRRLVQTDKYMALEVSFADPELDNFLPMTMKVTVPAGYNKENFAVLYTPNRKTIMAKMNGEFLKDGSYEFKIFQPGTYVIADCTKLVYVESLYLEEGDALTLRVGRSYSLDPVILPHAATNKDVDYRSSRTQIASVSEYGTLTAHKKGSTVVTIKSKDGSGISYKVRVTVTE